MLALRAHVLRYPISSWTVLRPVLMDSFIEADTSQVMTGRFFKIGSSIRAAFIFDLEVLA
jgi:hypothetical protein